MALVQTTIGRGEDRWPALLHELRRTTRPDHARVATFLGLAQRPGGWTEYREFLAIHHGWIAALDRCLEAAARRFRVPFSGRRLPHLDRDLFALAVPSGERTTAALIPAPRSRAEALGYLYVSEGFRLGCRVLARGMKRLGVGESGAAFVSGLGAGTRGAWMRLVHELAGVPPEEHAAVVGAARDLFGRWEEWLRSPQARVAQLQVASGVWAGS